MLYKVLESHGKPWTGHFLGPEKIKAMRWGPRVHGPRALYVCQGQAVILSLWGQEVRVQGCRHIFRLLYLHLCRRLPCSCPGIHHSADFCSFLCENVKLWRTIIEELCIVMVVEWIVCISQGEEVFNTYGELANWQLLHMYGFAESPSDNHYDAVS